MKSSDAPQNPSVRALDRLRKAIRKTPIADEDVFVYYPLDYAWPLARAYAERFGQGAKDVVFVGMNPGPYGMGQTGVPFGEVGMVVDWMKLEGKVTPPKEQHPKRPITGLSCTRSEVSGKRLWGAFAARHPEPESFFARAFVLNYCPLLFLGPSGANLTPDKLARETREAIEMECDRFLGEALAALSPRLAIGVGQYAAQRISRVTGEAAPSILHPSPASPIANRGWAEAARAQLSRLGVTDLL